MLSETERIFASSLHEGRHRAGHGRPAIEYILHRSQWNWMTMTTLLARQQSKLFAKLKHLSKKTFASHRWTEHDFLNFASWCLTTRHHRKVNLCQLRAGETDSRGKGWKFEEDKNGHSQHFLYNHHAMNIRSTIYWMFHEEALKILSVWGRIEWITSNRLAFVCGR